jgi:hypothetical protein
MKIMLAVLVMLALAPVDALARNAQFAHWTHADIRIIVAIEPGMWRDLALAGVRVWSSALPTAQFTIDPRADAPCRLRKRTITLCVLPNPKSGVSGWTHVRQRGHRITGALIRVREGWDAPQAWCHEIGHALGLRHDLRDDAESCVSDSSLRVNPGARDVDALMRRPPFIP